MAAEKHKFYIKPGGPIILNGALVPDIGDTYELTEGLANELEKIGHHLAEIDEDDQLYDFSVKELKGFIEAYGKKALGKKDHLVLHLRTLIEDEPMPEALGELFAPDPEDDSEGGAPGAPLLGPNPEGVEPEGEQE